MLGAAMQGDLHNHAALHCSNAWLLDDEQVTTPAIKRAIICVQEYS